MYSYRDLNYYGRRGVTGRAMRRWFFAAIAAGLILILVALVCNPDFVEKLTERIRNEQIGWPPLIGNVNSEAQFDGIGEKHVFGFPFFQSSNSDSALKDQTNGVPQSNTSGYLDRDGQYQDKGQYRADIGQDQANLNADTAEEPSNTGSANQQTTGQFRPIMSIGNADYNHPNFAAGNNAQGSSVGQLQNNMGAVPGSNNGPVLSNAGMEGPGHPVNGQIQNMVHNGIVQNVEQNQPMENQPLRFNPSQNMPMSNGNSGNMPQVGPASPQDLAAKFQMEGGVGSRSGQSDGQAALLNQNQQTGLSPQNQVYQANNPSQYNAQAMNTNQYQGQQTGVAPPVRGQQASVYVAGQGQQAGVNAPGQGQQAGVYAPGQGQQAGVYAPGQGQQAGVYAPGQGQQAGDPSQGQQAGIEEPGQGQQSVNAAQDQGQQTGIDSPRQIQPAGMIAPGQGQQTVISAQGQGQGQGQSSDTGMQNASQQTGQLSLMQRILGR